MTALQLVLKEPVCLLQAELTRDRDGVPVDAHRRHRVAAARPPHDLHLLLQPRLRVHDLDHRRRDTSHSRQVGLL